MISRIVNIVFLVWAITASYYSLKLSKQLKDSNNTKHAQAVQLTSCSASSMPATTQVSIDEHEKKSVEIAITPERKPEAFDAYRITAKLSAVEKFVQINDAQREQLKQKFQLELSKQEAPSLEDILGKDSADFYHSQVQAAYQKSHKEEVDKEVFYLARILTLSANQELQVRQVIADVKGSVDYLSHGSANAAANPIANLQSMLDSVKVQNDLLAEKIKNVLTSEQYLAFQEYQNNSSDSDFSLLHAEP